MNHRRNRPEAPNDTLEKPVILELAGNIAGKRVLDLGCGDAKFGLDLIEMGCQSYFGIDGSQNMIELAQQTLKDSAGHAEQSDLENWAYPTEQFDLVFSRLVLHYIEDISSLFEMIAGSLAQDGQFVFSVEHPVITSSEKRWKGRGKRQDWLVDNYFHPGRRENSWLGGQVVKYHRTIEHHFSALQNAGFQVESLREAEPLRERFLTDESFERRQRIPLFLIMSAKKLRKDSSQ
ncbi:MAG: class I SAM-dependent methyltransferase [Anaerolineae bacterium]